MTPVDYFALEAFWLAHEALSFGTAGGVRLPFGLTPDDAKRRSLAAWTWLLWIFATGVVWFFFRSVEGVGIIAGVQMARVLWATRLRALPGMPRGNDLAALLRASWKRPVTAVAIGGAALLLSLRAPVGLFAAPAALCLAAVPLYFGDIADDARAERLTAWYVLPANVIGCALACAGFPEAVLLVWGAFLPSVMTLPAGRRGRAALRSVLPALAALCGMAPFPFRWAAVAFALAALLPLRAEMYAAFLPARAALLKRRLRRGK